MTGQRRRSSWTLILGLALFATAGLYVLIVPSYQLGPSLLIFSLLPLGFVLLVIGSLRLAYADSTSVTIRPLHVVAVGAGFGVMLIGILISSLPVAAVGSLLLILGCLPWAFRLPWHVTLPIGAVLVGIACCAPAYVPGLLVPKPPEGPDDAAGALVVINVASIGLPGIVFTLSGLARVIMSMRQGARRNR